MSGQFKKWLLDDTAVAAIEAGFLFPVLVIILCGIVDTGIGLITNQKVITASQTISDLLTRQETVSDADISDAIVAGQLSLQPYDTTTMGADIVGIEFIGTSLTPTVTWRETFNMTANDSVLTGAEGLGLENEGLVAVTVRYTYTPYFSGLLAGDIQMEEVSYARGRRSLVITKV